MLTLHGRHRYVVHAFGSWSFGLSVDMLRILQWSVGERREETFADAGVSLKRIRVAVASLAANAGGFHRPRTLDTSRNLTCFPYFEQNSSCLVTRMKNAKPAEPSLYRRRLWHKGHS